MNYFNLSLCLFALLLQGCTINVYHSNPTHPSVSAHGAVHPGSSDSQHSDNSPVTVNAAAIMSIGTIPPAPLATQDAPLDLEVVVKVDAYVSCFYQQADGPMIKLFPNRVVPLYRLKSGQVLRIPRANGFRVTTSEDQTVERFMCLATKEDVTPNLPLEIQASAFQPISVESFDHLFEIYRDSTADNLIARVLEVPAHRHVPITRSLSLNAAYGG